MSERGEIITFYSYKGGTGRTMALANVGMLLARRGAGGTLLMDWDLEAPGLHQYFKEHARFAERPGTIDLLEDLAALVQGTGSADGPLDEDSTLALVRELSFKKYMVDVAESLCVVWAGCSDTEDYARRVSEFDWAGLYRHAPYLFTSLAIVLAESFRHVCIDSRTGISDTSGVCTSLLPEKLVVVFTPNRQSLDGALSRARSAVTYRRQSGDLRPLVVYPLASRVELNEEALRLGWRHGEERGTLGYQPQFEHLFSEIYALPECDLQAWFDEVQIQQTTRYAYGEQISVTREEATADRLSLAHSYESFTEALETTAPPWRVKRHKQDLRADPDREQEGIAMARLESERDWHGALANRKRMQLMVIRGYQLLFIAAALVAAAVLGTEYQSWMWVSFAAGLVAVGVVEVVGAAIGAMQWRRHAALSRLLTDEEYRFQARTHQYEDAANRGKRLAERVDDILTQAYGEWEQEKGRFGGLAAMPTRPDGARRRPES